jgi:endonuclease/exonuclease/phosphatase (EEP) superfamily protein YafD
VKLAAKAFEYVPEVFVQPDGNILSDHNPVLVNFSWSKAG